MNKHEGHLLRSLGDRYTEVVASAARADDIPGETMEETLRRSGKVFEGLAAEGGQKSSSVLWQQLATFVSAPEPRVARTGWDFAAQHVQTADSDGLNAVVMALSARITQELEDSDGRGLVLGDAGEALVKLCNARPVDLEDETLMRLSEVAVEWSA